MTPPPQIAPETPTAYVIDDDAALLSGIDNLLRAAGIATRIFTSPQAFRAAWRPSHCGCIILDIRFPEISGLDVQGELRESGIFMPVILMTGHADVPSSVRGMKAGAVDFLTKPFDEEDLLEAVTTAFDRDRERCAAEAGRSSLLRRYGELTAREKEVLALVTTGLMNKQVAGVLNLSEITVKVHRGTMMKKMGLRTLAELVKASELLKDEPIFTKPEHQNSAK